jgi:ABC-2 type transport system ATP-binding protein
MSPEVLKAERLTKKYPSFLLGEISFEIKPGQIVGLIGQNGAGKTTLLDILINHIRADFGTATILGKDSVAEHKEIKQDVGIVGDTNGYHELLSPKDISQFLKHVYRNWHPEEFKSFIDHFDIPYTQHISKMSKGMIGKTLLAIALSHGPKLLILDEITSGLDPIIRSEILEYFKSFVSDGKKAILFSTHITSDLEKVADRIILIHNGKILENKSLVEINAVIAGNPDMQNLDDFMLGCIKNAG